MGIGVVVDVVKTRRGLELLVSGLVHADGDLAGGRLKGGPSVGLSIDVLGIDVLDEASIACKHTQ